MKQKQIEQIRQACIQANPEKDWDWQGDYYATEFGLEDVLMAISKLSEEYILVSKFGLFHKKEFGGYSDLGTWQLTKPLQDQSDECRKFIHEIICK